MPRAELSRWRWPLSAALLAYAALAGASGLDRLADGSFTAEQWVPAAFRVIAEARAADRLIEAEIPESALAPAQRLVARDPLAPGSVALLGSALLGQGKHAEADRAFRLAARRGWRDARTQIYWLWVALAQNEPRLAALRFGALARQWPQAPAIAQIARVFEASPDGRRALAERIAAGDRWGLAYAQPSEAIPAQHLPGRADVLLATADMGKQLGCDEIAPLVGRLIDTDAVRASGLWQRHCAGAGALGALTDPDFERASFAGPTGPFSWEFPGDGALQVSLDANQGKQSLTVSNAGPVTLVFAAQRVVVAPGRYRLRTIGAVADGNLRVSLSCRRELINASPVVVRGGAADLTFAGPCAAPWLQLWLAPTSRNVVLRSVELTRS